MRTVMNVTQQMCCGLEFIRFAGTEWISEDIWSATALEVRYIEHWAMYFHFTTVTSWVDILWLSIPKNECDGSNWTWLVQGIKNVDILGSASLIPTISIILSFTCESINFMEAHSSLIGL